MKNNLTKEQFFSVAIMLFGLFFGAGNLIFPPLLGKQAGGATFQSLLAFGITAVVFPILGVVAVAKTKGLSNLASKVDKYFAIVFTTMIYMAIGPGLGIPRAGSLPFEMAVAPFLPENVSLSLSRLVYTFVFFLVAYLVCLKPNKLVTRMGKFLTPALLVLITVMFVGVLFKNPNAVTSPVGDYATSSTVKGFLEGYNTLDALASVAFSVIAVQTLKQLGFSSKKEYISTIWVVGIVVALAFSALYIGLGFLGNHFPVPAEVMKGGTPGVYILSQATQEIFGSTAQLFLAVMVTVTCFTTTVGLIVSTAEFFNGRFPQISYKVYATAFTLIGFAIANLGLDAIIKYSIPVLVILYPITIAIVMIVIVNKFVPLSKPGMQLTIGVVTAIAVASVLGSSFKIEFLANLVNALPFAKASLPWLVPAIIGILLSLVLPNKQESDVFEME